MSTAFSRSRRALLHGVTAAVSGAASAGLAACDLAPARARRIGGVAVLAPRTPGRDRRLVAWNGRYGLDDGVVLEPAALDPARFSGAHGSARALAELQSAGAPGSTWIVDLTAEAVPALALGRRLRPLDDLVQRDRVNLKAFMPCALQPGYGLDARLYALPESVDAAQLYFNRRHLEDAGIDFRRAGLDFERANSHWEGLRRVALDLMVGRQARERLPWHPGAEGMPLEVWGWMNGGGWISADGRRATFTRPENLQALSWLARHTQELGGAERLARPGPMAPAVTDGTAMEAEQHPLLLGRVSLYFDSTRLVSTLAGARPDFPLGYVEPPRRWEGWPLVTWARTTSYALAHGAPDELWPALRFLVGGDAAWADAASAHSSAPYWEGGPVGPPRMPAGGKRLWYPPYTGQLSVDKFMAGRFRTESKLIDEAHDHGMEQLRHARSRERSPAAERLWPLLQEARDRALGGAPPAEALGAAQAQAQALLDESWRGAR